MTSNDEKSSNSNQLPAKDPIFLINTTQAVLHRPTTAPIEKKWNTAHLPWRIFSDATAAASTAFLIAPIITSIDRYIRGSSLLLSQTSRLDLAANVRSQYIQGNN